MRRVVDSLKLQGGISTFSSMLGEVRDRGTAIGIFIALLELCRRRMIAVTQNSPKAEIQISLADVTVGVPANDADLETVVEEVAA
jgi:chromatin segregation and condensation protein Rec8/ScpA/Scc1 (kleisin family)